MGMAPVAAPSGTDFIDDDVPLLKDSCIGIEARVERGSARFPDQHGGILRSRCDHALDDIGKDFTLLLSCPGRAL